MGIINVTKRVVGLAFGMLLVCGNPCAQAQPGRRILPAKIEQSGDSMKVLIDSGRPLAYAVEALEAKYGWQVNYEDPQGYCAQETSDVTAQLSRQPGNPTRVLVPKSVRFELSFAPPANPATAAEKRRVLTNLIETSRSATGRQYTLVEEADSFDLVPAGFLDANCRFVARSSILDSKITLEPGFRSLEKTLREFVDELSRVSGRRVGIGGGPTNFMFQTQFSFSATNEPARSVIRRVLGSTRRKLAWQLLVGPGSDMTLLNLHFVELMVDDPLTGREKFVPVFE